MEFGVLVFDEEADTLAQEYVRRGVFPEKYIDDANHVAIAVTNGIEYFCSWNFTHLVKVNTRREVNLNAKIMLMNFGVLKTKRECE